jgi:predicted transcriptional regulator of viral defense system
MPTPATGRSAPTFTFTDALDAGITEARLRALLEQGAIERIGRGLYRREDAPPVDLDLLEIALRAPAATLCLTSALARHDLTDEIPSRIDIALPRSQRRPALRAPIAWHRFSEATFDIGRTTIEIEPGTRLGLYTPPRCIIDAYRLRHLEGTELARTALRRWLASPAADPAGLLRMARSFPKARPKLRDDLDLLLL